MTALLPGFQDQLENRAEALVAEPHGHRAEPARSRGRGRRRHGRGLAVAILVGALGVGGAAYAAKGIWSPQLGEPGRGEPATASTSPVPPAQLAMLGVLRRPQTAADRGAATRAALKFQDATMKGVRLAAVRRLGTTGSGGAVILLPVAAKQSWDSQAPEPDEKDALCLWLTDPLDGGGQTCASLQAIRAGRMQMSMHGPPMAEQLRIRARAERETERLAAIARKRRMTLTEYLNERNRERAGRSPGATFMRIPSEDMTDYVADIVQVVPDGVAMVRYRVHGKTVIAPVRGNVVIVHIEGTERAGLGMAWLDAQGRELVKGKRFPAVKS